MDFFEIGLAGFFGLKLVHIGYAVYNYKNSRK